MTKYLRGYTASDTYTHAVDPGARGSSLCGLPCGITERGADFEDAVAQCVPCCEVLVQLEVQDIYEDEYTAKGAAKADVALRLGTVYLTAAGTARTIDGKEGQAVTVVERCGIEGRCIMVNDPNGRDQQWCLAQDHYRLVATTPEPVRTLTDCTEDELRTLLAIHAQTGPEPEAGIFDAATAELLSRARQKDAAVSPKLSTRHPSMAPGPCDDPGRLGAYVQVFQDAKGLATARDTDSRAMLLELVEFGSADVAPQLWAENAEAAYGTPDDPHEVIVRRAQLALNRRERLG